MPTASPRSPRRNRQERRGVRFITLLGPTDGTAPTLENEVTDLELLGFSVSAGGSRVDSARFRFNLAKAGRRLQDTAAPIGYHRQIELRRLDEDGKPTIIAMWGFVAGISEAIEGAAEGIEVDVRLDPYVFGKPLTATKIWNVAASAGFEPRDVHWPFVFNPLIDGVIEGNRSGHREDADDDPPGPYVFVSPEAIRTGAARVTAQENETGSKWTLSEAVHRLCWSCNPDETFIKNPSLDEIKSAMEGEADVELKNVRLEFGDYLPANLDALLRPHGFGWSLKHELVDDQDAPPPEAGEEQPKKRETTITFYERGKGLPAELLMARVGKQITVDNTNVSSYRRSVMLADLANRVVARGGEKLYEGTFPLTPGWPSADDTRALGELALTATVGSDRPAVGRKYVINCAGDYCEPTREGVTDAYDFGTVLPGTWALVRRRLRPCISRQQDTDDARSYGYLVEWWDREAEDAADPDVATDPGWRRVREGYQVLEHEAGIYFHEPPGRLWQLVQEDAAETPPAGVTHPGLHLRITATVAADERLEAVATRTAESANGETLTLYLDLADQFHFRKVDADSVLHDKPNPDEVDDQERLQTYANKVRDLEQAADVSCSIVMPGVDHAELAIGMLLDRVDGRNLTLTANNPDAEEKRALQIVGFNFKLGSEQRTELLIETFRKERPAL